MTEEQAIPASAAEEPADKQEKAGSAKLPAWISRQLVIVAVAALIIGGGIGAIIGVSSQQGQIRDLSSSLASANAENGTLTSNNGALTAAVNKANADQAARAKKDADLTTRETAVAAGEAKLKSDQDAATAAQAAAAAAVKKTQLTNGVFVVGTTVDPGTYETDGPGSSDCYYAFKTGTGSNADIIDNNIVSGPATVTLNSGDVFESSHCSTWKKIG